MPGVPQPPSKILVAIDESIIHSNAAAALHWAARNLAGAGDEFHLVTVLPPAPVPLYPMAPIATVASVAHTWDMQRHLDEQEAASRLKVAAQMMAEYGVDRSRVHIHPALPAAGGASGVAESIVEFAKRGHMDMVVMGSRGIGSFKKSLLSLVGLGSVSDYCIHNLHTPVIVVRPDAHVDARGDQATRDVCVAYDGSPQSEYGLAWALQHLLTEGDMLHIVTVAPPVPYTAYEVSAYPTGCNLPAHEDQQYDITTAEGSLEHAEHVANKAGWVAVQMGWNPDALVTMSLPLEGSVGHSIAQYVTHIKADLLVVGARGFGSFKRSVMSLVGLGSVSDYLVHNVTNCPVVVVKAPTEQPAGEPQAAAAAAGAAVKGADGRSVEQSQAAAAAAGAAVTGADGRSVEQSQAAGAAAGTAVKGPAQHGVDQSAAK